MKCKTQVIRLPEDVYYWLESKSKINGIRVPFSRLVSHYIAKSAGITLSENQRAKRATNLTPRKVKKYRFLSRLPKQKVEKLSQPPVAKREFPFDPIQKAEAKRLGYAALTSGFDRREIDLLEKITNDLTVSGKKFVLVKAGASKAEIWVKKEVE